MTAQAGVDNGTLDSVDGALFDADHDGDLDILVVNGDGPNELFNNNGDSTFKPIAAQAGIAGTGVGSRQVLPVDLDGDRDLDIVVINKQPPNEVWINERAWRYSQADPAAFAWLTASQIRGIAAHDADADGDCRPFVLSDGLGVRGLRRNERGGWTEEGVGRTGPPPAQGRWFSLVDVAGDGQLHAVLFAPSGWSLVDTMSGLAESTVHEQHGLAGGTTATLDARGTCVVTSPDNTQPLVFRPGPGRFPFASVSFTGKQVTSDNKQVRSNASGIGTRFAARVGSNWVAGDTLRNSSGPGQSLQPVAIGLGGAGKIDFLAIDWSDGVFQSEIDLAAGTHHIIKETQRQLSSCPVLFAWDGERYGFITDLLGVGGMGYFVAPGECAPSRPWENLLLPQGALQPRDGAYVLKLAEPMEEACYLDSARLIAYDLPPGWDMTVDERMSIAGPEPTGEAMLYRSDSLRGATQATNDRGEDVTDSLRDVDLAAAPVGEMDARFIGLLKDEHSVLLSFDLDRPESERRCILLIDGWVEYPYSQTMFAVWQARAEYRAPTLEVRTASGEWKVVHQQFGYPAGMPRQMALPLPDGFAADSAKPIELRIRTNQEVYFDRIALVEVEECPDAVRHDLALNTARLADVGFPKRTTGPQRQPSYDYDQRAPLWDTRHQRGWYTEFGAVNELVAKQDDALAIFGPGEEIELRFDAASLPPLATGWKRRFVLEARGWCKDMDLYTKDGETLEPLPTSDPARNPATRDALHRRFNTRYESGR